MAFTHGQIVVANWPIRARNLLLLCYNIEYVWQLTGFYYYYHYYYYYYSISNIDITKFHAGASHSGVSSPRLLYRDENFTPVRNRATVSCKSEMTGRRRWNWLTHKLHLTHKQNGVSQQLYTLIFRKIKFRGEELISSRENLDDKL